MDALRTSGFTVDEAWPLDTERPGGMKTGKAMLASSVFLTYLFVNCDGEPFSKPTLAHFR